MNGRPLLRLQWLLMGLALASPATAERLLVSDFSTPLASEWESKAFVGQTRYQIVQQSGHSVLLAESEASASGLFRELEVDLNQTPWLNWSWRVENHYGPIDERSKGGDDYPARLYVIVSGGLLFWQSRAVNYVWSSSQPVGSHWSNAYTERAQMVAVASGDEGLGEWQHYRRNLRDDFVRLFGKEVSRIDALALMSDSDNSGLRARAWYGPIWFSSE